MTGTLPPSTRRDAEQGEAVPTPALIPRRNWSGPVVQSSEKRERKGQGRERTVLDRCSRLKYLEGVNMERREDLLRQSQGRIARNGIG